MGRKEGRKEGRKKKEGEKDKTEKKEEFDRFGKREDEKKVWKEGTKGKK